jgi:hypothetical protein
MYNFILTPEQRDLFKASWKVFLKIRAKHLKRNGTSRAKILAHQLIRHILLTDLSSIESKVVKSFSKQRCNEGETLPAVLGLNLIAYQFFKQDASYITVCFDDKFLLSLTKEQLLQISNIASTLSNKYQRGEI